jgi:phosphoserine phosphatase
MEDIIALIFDFDDTLVPDSTSSLLEEYGLDPEKFWNEEVKGLVNVGYEPTHAFLANFLKHCKPREKLDGLGEDDLSKFGNKISKNFFKGFPKILDKLTSIVNGYPGIKLEFYIISGGLQKIIEGTSVAKKFNAIYACELDHDGDRFNYIKRTVTFTEKTRYVFEINKGIKHPETLKHPYLVNEYKPHPKRRVPFENMIYVGDSRTDIPCFSLILNGESGSGSGGYAYAVFDPADVKSAASKFKDFIAQKRANVQTQPTNYEEDAFGATLKLAIQQNCAKIMAKQSNAYEII